MTWMITIAVVLSILVAAGVAAVSVNNRQQKKNRYMSVIAGSGAQAFASEESRDKKLAKQREAISKKLKEASGEAASKKKDKTTIRQLMMQAGIEAPLSRYWSGAAIFACVTWAVLSLMTSWPQIAVVFATFTAFLGVPKLFLKWKAGKRQKKFLADFSDALDASVRLLQAGMPISEAVAMVAREFDGPLREEMQRMYENQKIGLPLGAAALEMAHRVPLTEVHMFATALQIQSETGSSLSEVLSNLSTVIRARFRLKRKVKALSSEAKASAAIIAALPILVSCGLYLVNEKYISILFDTTKGNFFLGGAVFWMCCGILIMRQMINFKV
jgi:tight adherence protein B